MWTGANQIEFKKLIEKAESSFQMNFLLFIITLVIDVGCSQFSPRTSDYDSYGLKITGNDKMMIEALGDAQIFLVRYAPYNSTSQSLQCAITYNDSTKYVYSIGIGRKQNFNQSYFFYAGEIISKNSPDYGSPFIGILRNTDIKHAQIYEDTQTLFNCSHFQYQSLQIISSYEHQEFFVFAVEPYGQYAIGLSQDFVYIYRPFSYNKITIKKSGEVWPTDTIFIPFAVDMDSSFTIVAGFVINGPLFRVRGTPTVYVISNSDLTVLSTWSYTAVLNSWQSRLTYSNLKKWSSKYIMSVSINGDDPSQVLIGMPFLNIAFLLNVNLNGSNITMNSYIDNGDSIGFGKSVVWLSKSQAAILSSNSPKNDSSKIYLYDSFNKTTLPPSPDFVFPNIQQSLPSTINARFIRMISIGNSLAILGIDSEILMILSTPPGYFPSTSLSTSESIFVVSESIKCMSGTYKSDNSIFPCSLCPSGSRNLGNLSAISCITCSSDSFCPMGSVFDIERDYLVSRSQAYVHPRSPEVTIFDEILLQNMFSTGSRINCLSVSPIFWVLIVAALVLIILSVMGIIKRCVQHPLGHKVRRHVKRIFRQTDLLVNIFL